MGSISNTDQAMVPRFYIRNGVKTFSTSTFGPLFRLNNTKLYNTFREFRIFNVNCENVESIIYSDNSTVLCSGINFKWTLSYAVTEIYLYRILNMSNVSIDEDTYDFQTPVNIEISDREYVFYVNDFSIFRNRFSETEYSTNPVFANAYYASYNSIIDASSEFTRWPGAITELKGGQVYFDPPASSSLVVENQNKINEDLPYDITEIMNNPDFRRRDHD